MSLNNLPGKLARRIVIDPQVPVNFLVRQISLLLVQRSNHYTFDVTDKGSRVVKISQIWWNHARKDLEARGWGFHEWQWSLQQAIDPGLSCFKKVTARGSFSKIWRTDLLWRSEEIERAESGGHLLYYICSALTVWDLAGIEFKKKLVGRKSNWELIWWEDS